MKKTIYILCVLAIVAALLFWWRGWHDKAEVRLTAVDGIESNAVDVVASQMRTPTNSVQDEKQRNTATLEKGLEALKEREELANREWRAPVDFFGKIVDQNGTPVSEAKAVFGLNNLSGHSTIETFSDGAGLFELRNKQGKHLSVQVSKEGYYSSKEDPTGFFYAGRNDNFQPDRNNPIVFHLRKKGEGAEIITTDFPPGVGQIAQLHGNGIPIEIDLMNAKAVSEGSGHLKLELSRGAVEKGNPKFDWELRLSVPGGGLVETDEEFAFQALEDGYQPSIIVDMPATNQNWRGELRARYYIHFPDGKYGRIDFYLLARNGVFRTQSAINPSGSRYLEPK